jgi:hypothetical protein
LFSPKQGKGSISMLIFVSLLLSARENSQTHKHKALKQMNLALYAFETLLSLNGSFYSI